MRKWSHLWIFFEPPTPSLVELQYVALTEILAWCQPCIMTNADDRINIFSPEISWIAQKWLKISYFQVVLLLVNFYFHMLQGDYFYLPWNSGAINCRFMMRFVNFFWLIHHCLALNCTCLCTFNTLIGGNLSNFCFEFVDIITTDQSFKLKFQLSLSLSASTISEKILISNCMCVLVYILCVFLLPYVLFVYFRIVKSLELWPRRFVALLTTKHSFSFFFFFGGGGWWLRLKTILVYIFLVQKRLTIGVVEFLGFWSWVNHHECTMTHSPYYFSSVTWILLLNSPG